MKKSKIDIKKNPRLILRLLKAGIFMVALIFYGLTSGILSQFLFAVALYFYLKELYEGVKK